MEFGPYTPYVTLAVVGLIAGWLSGLLLGGGGLMVQRLADQPVDDDHQEDWHRTMLLLGTATDAELLDPALPADALLYRLFHEERVRVFAPQELRFGCRCTRERVEKLLRSFPDAEVEEMRQDDGLVVVTCQFCNAGFRFDEAQLARLHARRAH